MLLNMFWFLELETKIKCIHVRRALLIYSMNYIFGNESWWNHYMQCICIIDFMMTEVNISEEE